MVRHVLPCEWEVVGLAAATFPSALSKSSELYARLCRVNRDLVVPNAAGRHGLAVAGRTAPLVRRRPSYPASRIRVERASERSTDLAPSQLASSIQRCDSSCYQPCCRSQPVIRVTSLLSRSSESGPIAVQCVAIVQVAGPSAPSR